MITLWKYGHPWLKVRSIWAQIWKGENEIQQPITLNAVKKEPYGTVCKTYGSEWEFGKTTNVTQEFLSNIKKGV